MTPTITLQLIGPLRVQTAAGKPLSLPNRKTRALLVYLAQTARPHARPALSALFCQNSDDPGRALRWHLTVIRRHLGLEALLASADTVRLNRQVVQTVRHREQMHPGAPPEKLFEKWLPDWCVYSESAMHLGRWATQKGASHSSSTCTKPFQTASYTRTVCACVCCS